MFCKNCSAPLPDDAKFCDSCGTPVTPSVPPVTQDVEKEVVGDKNNVKFSLSEIGETSKNYGNYGVYGKDVKLRDSLDFDPFAEDADSTSVSEEFSSATNAPELTAQPVQPPKKKKKGGKVVLIIVAIVLVLSLLLGASCCGIPLIIRLLNADAQEATPNYPSYDVPVTPTHDDPSVQETLPMGEPVDLTVKEAELVYELTDADVEEFYDLLALSEDKALYSDDSNEVDEITNQLDEKYEYLETQYGIAMVLYYCDLNDQEASDLYLSCTDTVTQANNDYLEMARRIYLSDSPHKDMLFEDWTEEEIQMLLAYTDEVMQLQQRNSEIEVAYQDMQDSATMYDDMVPLYLEMVENNNRIAQIYGYDNYYEYAYEQVYGRDYDTSEIEKMRQLVATYLPDAMSNSLNSFMATMEDLSYTNQLKLSTLLYEPYYSGSKEYLTGYLNSLPSQARSDMADMFSGNILLMDDSSGAMEGAFTTNLTADRSVCFFGPGYSNVLTVVHEVGHYYGSKHVDLDELPMDLAETQSQSNEWLFIAYMEDQMNADLYDALVNYKMYENMTTIVICTIVDEFEEQVYTHPNPASLTGDDLDAIMEEICNRYGGTDFLSGVATDVQYYWRMVVVEQPVYYISYGVSAIAALDVYTVAQQDYSKGVEIYCNLIEDVNPDEGFLSNITDAGLAGPFDDDVYAYIADMFN